MLNFHHDKTNFFLVPVEVLPVDCEVFRYETRPSGPALSANSVELLLPGDYSMMPNGEDTFYFAGEQEQGCSSLELQNNFPENYHPKGDRCLLLDEQVRNRDGRCLLTGISATECELTSVWIMLPSTIDKKQTIQQIWVDGIPFSDRRYGTEAWDAIVSQFVSSDGMRSHEGFLKLQKITGKDIDISLCPVIRVDSTLPVRDEMAEYIADPDPRDWSQTAKNYITIRQDLAEMFMDNKITIDPEDNYRIVIPHLSDEIKKIPLLEHMPLDHITDRSLRPLDRFFRGHLFRTLTCNFGGDVSRDYAFEFEDYMEDLGVFDGTADPTNPEWQTQLGKEVWAMLMRQKLSD